MNVIVAYLETMFSAYPQTPRLLEAKAELQGMMEDAYTSLIAEGRSENEAVGQVIRDFGNIDEVAPVLGITAEIAPAAPSPGPAAHHGAAVQYGVHLEPVKLEDAQAYATAQQQSTKRIAIAVVLFVLSPAVLIALPVAAERGLVPISQELGVFVGLLVLLACVTIGVLLSVSTNRFLAPHRHIVEGRFAPNPGVTRWAEGLAAQHERARIRALQIAIALWILSPIPLIGMALLQREEGNNFGSVMGVVLVLIFVAAGLAILLPNTWAQTVSEKFVSAASRSGYGYGTSGAGEYGASGPESERSIVSVIAAFYWPLLVAAYLAWSFLGNAWHISWLIWPIGVVLFAALAAGLNAIESYRKAGR